MKVEFHSGVGDKFGTACRFLRKAQDAGATAVVCADGPSLDRLDLALWTFDPLSFIAHARVKGSAPPPTMARTRTWLVDAVSSVAGRQLLVNLGPTMVEGWDQFARVVEIVSAEADDAMAGRQRWRQYSAYPGIELVHHPKAAGA
ncbi:MAG: DNA polymerase III subunit chi [Pseudomonadota bacterium]